MTLYNLNTTILIITYTNNTLENNHKCLAIILLIFNRHVCMRVEGINKKTCD